MKLKYALPDEPKEQRCEIVFIALHGIGDNPQRVLDSLLTTGLCHRGLLVSIGAPVKPAAHQSNRLWHRQNQHDCSRTFPENVSVHLASLKKVAAQLHAVFDMLVAHGYHHQNFILWGIGQGGPIAVNAANTYSKPLGGVVVFEAAPLVNRTNAKQLRDMQWQRQTPLFVRLGALSRRTTPTELSRQLKMMNIQSQATGATPIVQTLLNPLVADCFDLVPEDISHLSAFFETLSS